MADGSYGDLRFGSFELSSTERALRRDGANESTPQKSMSRRLGSRPFKNYLSNCGIVAAIGLTVDVRDGTAPSTMTVSGAARDIRELQMRIYSLAH
jgi:hypothetical protein